VDDQSQAPTRERDGQHLDLRVVETEFRAKRAEKDGGENREQEEVRVELANTFDVFDGFFLVGGDRCIGLHGFGSCLKCG